MADRRYVLEILITGKNETTRPLTTFTDGLTRLKTIVSGILLAGGIHKLGSMISGLGTSAFDAFNRIERLNIAAENLIANELAQGTLVERTTTFIGKLSDAQIATMQELQSEIDLLNAKLVHQGEQAETAAEKHGNTSYQYLRVVDSMKDTRSEIAELVEELSALETIDGKLVTQNEMVREGVTSVAEQLDNAAAPARRLTQWIEKLALITPFSEDQIATAFRAAAAYGIPITTFKDLATEEEALVAAREADIVTAQRLTKALTDLVAGVGLPNEYIQSIAIAMGQVQAKGKLAAEEIRQFVNAGIGINLMAQAMGMTTGEFKQLQEEGKILAEDFLPAVVRFLENSFGGASERMLNTLGGTVDALKGIKDVLLRDFAAPLFDRIQPKLFALFQYLASEEVRATVKEFGERFGESAYKAWVRGKAFWDFIEKLGTGQIDLRTYNFEFLFPEGLGKKIEDVRDRIFEIDEKVREWGVEGGLLGMIEGAGIGIGGLIAGGFVRARLLGILGLLSKIPVKLGAVGIASALFVLGWKEDFQGMKSETTNAWEQDLRPALEGLAETIRDKFPQAVEAFKGVDLVGYLQRIQEEGTLAGEVMGGLVRSAADAVEQVDRALESMDLSAIPGFIADVEEDPREAGREFWPKFWGFFFDEADLKQYDESGDRATAGIVNFFRNLDYKEVGRAFVKGFFPFVNLFDEGGEFLFPGLNDVADEMARQLGPALQEGFDIALGKTVWADAITFWETVLDPLFGSGVQEAQPVFGRGRKGFLDKLFFNVLEPASRDFNKWIEEELIPIYTPVVKLAHHIGVAFRKAQTELEQNIMPPMLALLLKPGSTTEKMIQFMIEAFATGLPNVAITIASGGQNIVDAINGWLNIIIGGINEFIESINAAIAAIESLMSVFGNIQLPRVPSVPEANFFGGGGSKGGARGGGTGLPGSSSGGGPGTGPFISYESRDIFVINNRTDRSNQVALALVLNNQQRRVESFVG